jgi:multimeric flavodoxin WrbA
MLSRRWSCPWHNWKFHRCSGVGEPGFERDRVPAYPVKVEHRRVLVNLAAGSKRAKSPHEPPPLSRKVERAAGPMRVAGIATTAMDAANPRFSGSDHLLDHALKAARELGAETRMIKLNDLNFRACEGYYSKAARACTWPCSITQMDAKDEMDQVYEALVHWADAVIVSSPIRWGAASSLYFKMAERLNCVQNAVTIRNQVLIRNKVAGFIIVGGQDNIVVLFAVSVYLLKQDVLRVSLSTRHKDMTRERTWPCRNGLKPLSLAVEMAACFWPGTWRNPGGALPWWSAVGLAAPAQTSTASPARTRSGARRSPTWCITAQASVRRRAPSRPTWPKSANASATW